METKALNSTLKLLPLDADLSLNKAFYEDPACLQYMEIYPEFYKKVGYDPSWIGYFIQNKNK